MTCHRAHRSTTRESILSRRELFRRGALGAGWMALANLLCEGPTSNLALAAGSSSAPINSFPQFSAPAHRMVLLFQHGGPSQIDLFDPKPALDKHAGEPIAGGVDIFFDKQGSNRCVPSPFKFAKHGESGMEFSELLPHLATCADDLCMIRSLNTVANDHEGALRHFQTGKPRVGRPTIGSWLTYALGSENHQLPPYVVLSDPNFDQVDGIRNWSSGFLPAVYQGTPLRPDSPALFDLELPAGITEKMRRTELSFLEKLNREHQKRFSNLSELDARIANYALAGNIRDEVTAAMDATRETAKTQESYGMDNPATGTYGRRCLLARRLLERGVRFVAVFNDNVKNMGDPWDTHTNHNQRTRWVSGNVDQPSAALIQDLKQRGMLDDTVVMWVGEFGRLPVAQGQDGRDHNRHAFTALVAGGGFKRGLVYGKTDEFGYKIAENPVGVGDLHATLLRQFGIDHTKLAVLHQGRNESLTDADINEVRVVSDLIS